MILYRRHYLFRITHNSNKRYPSSIPFYNRLIQNISIELDQQAPNCHKYSDYFRYWVLLSMASLKKASRQFYRPEIDGLRALAVIAVIINHFNSDILPSGFLGVDIFFAISGFVVTSSFSGKPNSSWKDYLLGFYSRRVKRLFPALSVCVVITSIIGSLFIYKPGNSIWTGITALAGFSNLFLLQRSTDYFGQSAELNLFTQTWSLGVEEQFYLVFPILLGICGFSRQRTQQGARNLFLAVLSLCVISLIGYFYLTQTNVSGAFFLMPARFWELGAGCLTFLLTRQLSQNHWNRWYRLAAPITTFLLVSVLFVNKDHQIFSTFAITVLTCMVLWTFSTRSLLVTVFSLSWIVKIGLLSYSLYLWHWSVIVISRWTIGVSRWTIPLQLLLIFGLALASYSWIEKPLRYAQWSTKKFKTIIYGLCSSLASIGLLIVLGKYWKERLYQGDTDALNTVMAAYGRPNIPNTPINENNCFYFSPPSTQQAIRRLEKRCSADGLPSQPKMYLYGDSHAHTMKGLIGRLHLQNKFSIETYSAAQTPFPFLNYKKAYYNLPAAKEVAISLKERITENSKPSDLVLLNSWLSLYFGHSQGKRRLNRIEAVKIRDLETWLADVSKLATRLSSKKASLILMAPLPEFEWDTDFDPRICTKEWYRPFPPTVCSGSSNSKQILLEDRQHIMIALNSTAAKHPNFYIYDPFDVLCPDKTTCYTHIENVPMYRDYNHLSNLGAQYLYDDFIKFLKDHRLL